MRFIKVSAILLISVWLSACSGQEPPPVAVVLDEASLAATTKPTETTAPPTEIATTSPTVSASNTPTVVPPTNTATAVPPTVTMVPSTETPIPPPTATADPGRSAPKLIWLPFSYGSYGSPILTIDGEGLRYAPEPASIEIFFDYDPIGGRLAYGSLFFYGAANGLDSVTDLWVYDYTTNTVTQWLDDNVGRAAWAPVANNGLPQLAVALHNGETFDLHLMSEPFSSKMIRDNVRPFFSWSPNGQDIAYTTTDGKLMVSGAFAEPQVETTYGQDVYTNGGWVGDAPEWDLERNYLIYADNPFTIAGPLDSFVPTRLDGSPLQEPRPSKILWSAKNRQLIGQIEDFTQNIQIYLLSEDLNTVTDSYLLENQVLVDWYVEGESIIVIDIDQQPLIWSLSSYEYIEP